MNLSTYDSREEQAIALADKVADELIEGINQHGKVKLAVPGGSTPIMFFNALSSLPVRWKKVGITLTDERIVPITSDRSNQKLLTDYLLSALGEYEFLPLISGDNPEPIQRLLPLHTCVLGMGIDGHFASLFPGMNGLEEALNPTSEALFAIAQSIELPENRISLSLSALLSATHIHLLITGEEKHQILKQAIENIGRDSEGNNPVTYPIEALLRYGANKLEVHYAE